MENSFDLIQNKTLFTQRKEFEVKEYQGIMGNWIVCEKCCINICSSEETSKQMCTIYRTKSIRC